MPASIVLFPIWVASEPASSVRATSVAPPPRSRKRCSFAPTIGKPSRPSNWCARKSPAAGRGAARLRTSHRDLRPSEPCSASRPSGPRGSSPRSSTFDGDPSRAGRRATPSVASPGRDEMPKLASYDAVVVGAGPNGLAAAVALAQAGHSVLVVEAKDRIGGGSRTAELTLPGYRHDICSSIHPMAVASPWFQALPPSEHGLEWVKAPSALAHPLYDGTAAILMPSLEPTA